MDEHDKDYFVPNFGVDHDIISTQNNLKNAEAKAKAFAQIESIPACTSFECKKKTMAGPEHDCEPKAGAMCNKAWMSDDQERPPLGE